MIEAMIFHALAEVPVECCGLIGAKGGVMSLYPAMNHERSARRFSISAAEQARIASEMAGAGDALAGTYHSHTTGEPRPSRVDIQMLSPLFGPPFVHYIVGIADPASPDVRAFQITGRMVWEQGISKEVG